jgi:two-component system cell cycle sensor histidine kinase/response regulator CckA
MQSVGNIAGGIAHDFNNILTAIIGFCDLLLLNHSKGEQSFNHIMQIKHSASRGANLVSHLLSFSRRQTLILKLLDLNRVFDECSSIIKSLINPLVQLKINISENLWFVKFDPVQFEQVILNLVLNSQHAITNDGRIIIKVFNKKIKGPNSLRRFLCPPGENKPSAGEYVIIEIKDNGTGIDSAIYDKIFDPFFTTRQKSGGTGLGLSNVYGIVRQSGGYLLFQSEVGKGTTFKILLPRQISESGDNYINIQARSELTEEGISATILLVEDDAVVRSFISSVLTSKGYKVIEYISAQEALVAFNINNKKKIDLVISDVVMPGRTGPEFIKQLTDNYGSLKVLFISGYAEEIFTENYGCERNFNFLAKPFSLKDLTAKVQQILNQKLS